MRQALLRILFAVLCGVAVAGLMWGLDGSDGADAMPAHHIPYPYELQEMLRVEGYDLAVDGIIGNQTLRAWHDYCEKHSNEMANEMTAEAVKIETKERNNEHE